jgi:hypothetical protein
MIKKTITEKDISVLVCWPDDPDEGRGSKVAHDALDGETISELLTRVIGEKYIRLYPATVAHIVVELRVKGDVL